MADQDLHPLLGASDIKALLAEHGLAPTKKRGQNFVTDPNTVARIVRNAGVHPGDLVVEVGPGLGSLTLALLHADAEVIAVELDHGLAKAVTELTQGAPIEVVCADATKVDWAEITKGRPAKMVANLPYNVATPIVMQALKGGHLTGYHVMVQKEVGQRWCAGIGDDDLGAVSMKMAILGEAKIAGTVARQAFTRSPMWTASPWTSPPIKRPLSTQTLPWRTPPTPAQTARPQAAKCSRKPVISLISATPSAEKHCETHWLIKRLNPHKLMKCCTPLTCQLVSVQSFSPLRIG